MAFTALVAALTLVATAGVVTQDGAQGAEAASHTAPDAGAPEVVTPVIACEELTSKDFSGVSGAPTAVSTASVVTPSDGSPPYCLVSGYVSPQIHFEVRLPTETWRQRFLKLGCGGYCGRVRFRPLAAAGCRALDTGTMAVAYDDQGHQGNVSFDGVWGHNGPQLRVDFGYRSGHAVTLASKALIKAFYGKGPRYSYFTGCSGGGREALMEAQRYPEDFDGIVAGAPGLNGVALLAELQTWLAVVNRDERGRVILTEDKLPGLHKAVLDRCDGNDGLVDGQIDDPRTCDFDPDSITCPAGLDRPDCLTPSQVETVRKVYQGPVDGDGRRLYPGSVMRGGELAWVGFVVPRAGESSLAELAALNYFKHFAFWENPPSSFTLDDHKFDVNTLRKLQNEMSGILDATNPDLSAFRKRGGRLIMWHHWSDNGMPAPNTLNYFDALRRYNGGKAGADSFVKLYMIPGPWHCNELPVNDPSPGTFDLVTSVIDWVEKGMEPGRVVVSRVRDGTVTRTRPVFPYPRVARYDGSGSIDDQSNFVPVTPARLPDLHTEWAGAPFKPGDQEWCTWNGKKLVCKTKRPPEES